jgi:hypothetical protein
MGKEGLKKLKENTELDFLCSYYPIPCLTDKDSVIDFYFASLNILTASQFDAIIKEEDILPMLGSGGVKNGFNIFRSIFVKEDVSTFEEKLLTYKTKSQEKLNTFNFTKLNKSRDKKYLKETKSINFITGCRLDEAGTEVLITGLSLDSLLKQIKDKTLIQKTYSSQRYSSYLSVLKEQFKSNTNKIIPLQEGRILSDFFTRTSLSQLKDFLIPGCKAHKIGELINTIKTNLSVKEFKNSKNYGRIHELRGEAIRYFYNEKNYTQLGRDRSSVLYNSCMRHNSCFEQLKFYSNNPESIALLVVMDKNNPRQITARTILWTTVQGNKVIDRVYYNRQEDVNILVTYCKGMGYGTVYSGTADAYGLLKTGAVVHIQDPEDTGLPYFDTMHCWERINSLLSADGNDITTFCKHKGLDYSLDDQGGGYIFYRNRNGSGFSIKGRDSYEYIKDIYNKPISDRGNIIVVDLPRKGYLSNDQIKMLGYPLGKTFRTAEGFIKLLKNKYNCVADALYRSSPDKYVQYIDDKKNLVYSTVLKTYINKEDSYFNYNLNGYIYKESVNDPTIKNIYKLRKLRNIYMHKCVSLTEEGYTYLKQINEYLVVPFNIIKVRPSRKFKIEPQNIQLNGIILKDINIPFKYLKTIKRNGENKK